MMSAYLPYSNLALIIVKLYTAPFTVASKRKMSSCLLVDSEFDS
jgi:hypothetical protein